MDLRENIQWKKNEAAIRRAGKMGYRFWKRQLKEGKILEEDFRLMVAPPEEACDLAAARMFQRWKEPGAENKWRDLNAMKDREAQAAFVAEEISLEHADWSLAVLFKAGLVEPFGVTGAEK